LITENLLSRIHWFQRLELSPTQKLVMHVTPSELIFLKRIFIKTNFLYGSHSTRADEQERGITIKSTAISMFFELDKEEMEDVKQQTNGELNEPPKFSKIIMVRKLIE
jgi:hypothetical protein